MSNTNARPLAIFSQGQLQTDNSAVLSYIAQQAVTSKLFASLRSEPEAIMKIAIGREFGLSLYESLTELNYIENRIEMSAVLMAKLVRRSGRYDYRVKESDHTKAAVEFFRINGSERESLGTSTFTLEDAKRAGLLSKANWQRYPKAMLFWRALSQGVSFFCPDAIEGGHVYVTGEISDAPLNPTSAPRAVQITEPEVTTGEPLTIEQEVEPPTTAATAPPATVSPLRRRSQTAKDTDPVLDVQIEAWYRHHREAPIPKEWDDEQLAALNVKTFEELNVGQARHLLLDTKAFAKKMRSA